MAPCRRKEQGSINKKGAWTADEDAKLSDYIDIHASNSNPKKWKSIAAKSGVNRSGKSCRLRWLNYLRPNIKRGNISDDEEDLIIRLHNLLGNRWSLIAGRIPGRTDNEIKNYWNSYLSKKLIIIKQKKKDDDDEEEVETPSSKGTATDQPSASSFQSCKAAVEVVVEEDEGENYDQFVGGGLDFNFDADDIFDFSDIGTLGLDWVDNFLKLDDQVQLDTKDEPPRQ